MSSHSSSNRLVLDQTLADRLNGLLSKEAEARMALAREAAEIRRQYLSANGTRYAPEFIAFWKKFQMEKTFGKLPQFTKYASAGEVVQRVEEKHAEHAPALPSSIKTLYHMSLLSEDELGEFLDTHAAAAKTTPSAQEPDKRPPINDAAVNAWRQGKRNPQPEASEPPFLRLAEVKIHGSFGMRGQDGSYSGKIDKDQIIKLLAELRTVIGAFDPALVQMVCADDQLFKRYDDLEKKQKSRSRKKIDGDEKHLRNVEYWLRRCLTPRNIRPGKRRETPNEKIPFGALKMIADLGIPTVIQDGPKESIPSRPDIQVSEIIEPTKKEFIGALCREIMEKAGADRFWAVVCRAQRLGDWREKITVSVHTKKKDRQQRRVSKMELELRISQKILRAQLGSADSLAKHETRIAEILSYLSPDLAAKTPEERRSMALKSIEDAYGPANAS